MTKLPNPEKQGFDRTPALEERVRDIIQKSAIFAGMISEPFGETAADTTEEIEEDWYSRRVLFVNGPHASGKSAVAHTALTEAEFALFDTGPIMRSYHQLDSPQLPIGQWIGGNEANYGMSFTDELLNRHIQTAIATGRITHKSGIVVIGNRSYNGINYLRDTLNPSDARILYVDAPPEVLYERYKIRERKHDMSCQEFATILNTDVGRGLPEIAERADHYIINDTELEFAVQQLRDYVETWRPAT